jgi:hypothetical protein
LLIKELKKFSSLFKDTFTAYKAETVLDLNWNPDGASSWLPEAHLLFITSTVASHQLDCFPDLMYYHEM